MRECSHPGDKAVCAGEGSSHTAFSTPWDNLIPCVSEPSVRFYLDAIRIYLALCAGTLTFEEAVREAELLKSNPEFSRFPTDPTLHPVSESIRDRILENLRVLRKYDLFTTESVRSAYSFGFMTDGAPVDRLTLAVLKALVRAPLIHAGVIRRTVGACAKAVSRRMDILRERNTLRFTALVDTSSFDVQSVLLFFSVRDEEQWMRFEQALSYYPFTKGILKTSLSPLGYVSFLIPGPVVNVSELMRSVDSLAPDVFDNYTLHLQRGLGASWNLELFEDGKWALPCDVTALMDATPPGAAEVTAVHRLSCTGPLRGLDVIDFAVASQLRVNSRMQAVEIHRLLRLRGLEVSERRAARSVNKLYRKRVVTPVVSFGGLGLSTNFCFEIICDPDWRGHIIERLPLLPSTVHFESHKGLVVWIQVPGEQQVEYYRMFRSLEAEPGVHSVQPIMTVRLKGSKSMLDIVRYWNSERRKWVVPRVALDLTRFMPD